MGLLEPKVDYAEYEIFRRETQKKLSDLTELLQAKTSELHKEIQHKATDSEQLAREAADRTIETEGKVKGVESRVEEILNSLEEYRKSALADSLDISKQKESLTLSNAQLAASIKNVNDSYQSFLQEKESVDDAISHVLKLVDEIKQLLAQSKVLSEQAEIISTLHSKVTDAFKNISGLLDSSMKKKNNIDELHKEILGYEIKSDSGESQYIEGIRDELQGAYENIKESTNNLETTISALVNDISKKYDSNLEAQKGLFDDLIVDSKNRINSVDDELKALLPGGLAAGLSAAYEAKKDEEIKSQASHATQFGYAIVALVAVSLIPFAIDAYLLIWKEKDIVDVIKDTPNLILSILPLYFPVLWYAFSSNKKLNLSKRPIEEYTHKAVLGRTFSGLSNQIINLPHENAVKEDLRTRLLFNLLQVSSENPGKLITDYNKSDHPFMEALENSAKLSASVETLAKLPGFSAIAERLAQKSQKIANEQSQMVSDGLAIQDSLETRVAANSDQKPN